jgi:hypothetical protein
VWGNRPVVKRSRSDIPNGGPDANNFGGVMSIYEAVGMAWVIFTSAIATVEIMYLAFVGLKTVIKRQEDVRDSDVPVEVKEMFKIAR